MKNIIKKIERESNRLTAKISDNFFKTTKFDMYQRRHSKSYQNDFKLKENQFCFVHIPRTGGSSLHGLLLENREDFYKGVHTAVSLLCNPKKYKYITVLRDPIERVFSFYLIQRKYKKLAFNPHAKQGLEFFLKNVWSCNNGICKFLNGRLENELNDSLFKISLENLENFYFIVDFENFDNNVKILSSKLNIKNDIEQSALHQNNYETAEEKLTKEYKELIKKFNLYDIEIYKIYKEKYRNKY